MTHQDKQSGFTLVELLLALAFVSFILIFATTTIIQIMRTYNKGLAVKEINQTARATMEDMGRIIKSSSPSSIVINTLDDNPVNSKGRVCFGSISYVWNFKGDTAPNKYEGGTTSVHFARVNDQGSSLCTPLSPGIYPDVKKADATELLNDSVWIQQLMISSSVNGTFYDVYIQLSTAEDLANPGLVYTWANPNREQRVVCKGGNEGQFCAVANFSTSVNAQGGTN